MAFLTACTGLRNTVHLPSNRHECKFSLIRLFLSQNYREHFINIQPFSCGERCSVFPSKRVNFTVRRTMTAVLVGMPVSLFCSVLHPHLTEQCLAHGTHSENMCGKINRIQVVFDIIVETVGISKIDITKFSHTFGAHPWGFTSDCVCRSDLFWDSVQNLRLVCQVTTGACFWERRSICSNEGNGESVERLM